MPNDTMSRYQSWCHALTLESLCMSLFGLVKVWFGVGILCFVIYDFCISMFWPGIVLNQGQLSIIVSDWEPYLGSPFPSFLCGKLTLFRAHSLWAFVFVVLFVLFGVILFNKRKCTLTTLHVGPLLSTAVTLGLLKKLLMGHEGVYTEQKYKINI
jgi:hypothetical protein